MNLCDIPASYADAASNAREAGYEKVRLVPRKAGVRCPLPQLVEWPLVGTFVFVRLIVKLSTNWNDTTSTHVAGEPCSTEALTDLIYEGLAEPRLFGLGRGSRFGENWSVYFSESVTSGKLNCAQSPTQVSNGVAGLAAGGSSLDRKKSRQFVRMPLDGQLRLPRRHASFAQANCSPPGSSGATNGTCAPVA
jgi:hypothetical protein